jgi:PAS domain S-box-containing protein/diguanylate cyclase (GGDEF)-like protein
MPYVICQHCGFRAYSAAGHASVDECPACGTQLPPRRVRGEPSHGGPLSHGAVSVRVEKRGTRIRAEIERRLGHLPAFFEPALANAGVLRDLWDQTQREWLDSPVPAHFRHALLAALAAHSPWPWRAVALESNAASEAGAAPDVERLIATPLTDVAESPSTPFADWPGPGTAENDELLGLTLRLLVDGPEAVVRTRLQGLLGDARYASLLAVLTYLETCRTFAQGHPEVAAKATSHYRRASDPVDVAMFELDPTGAIVSFSPAAEALFGYSADAVTGRPVAELFASEFGPALAQVVAPLVRAEQQPFRTQSLKLVGRRRDASVFEAAFTLTPGRRDGQSGAVVAVADVGRANRRADHAAAYRVLLGLLAGQATSLPPAAVLDAIAQSLGWQLALVWRLDPEEGVLRCVALRGLDGEPTPAVGERAAAAFAPGEGMVGAAYKTGEAAWVDDLEWSAADGSGEPAAVPGMCCGLWLPVASAAGVVGVLELLSTEHRAPDPVLLELLKGLAGHASALVDSGTAATAPGPAEVLSGARLAFEGAPVGMALVSHEAHGDGVITEANRAMAVLIGREASELVGLSLRDLMEPEDAELDADLMRQLLAGRIPSYQVDKRFRRANGEVFAGELNVSLIRAYDTGRPLYVVVQLADVTDRKRAEDALLASRERLASAFDEAPTGMAITTLDGRWLQVNATLCQTLGYEEAELLSKHLVELVHPDDLHEIRRYVGQLFAGEVLGYHVETRLLRADGEPIWAQVSVSLVHDYDGAPAYVLSEVQDVTERKRLEEELEQGALHDDLTGLPSRTLLFDRLEQASMRLERTGRPFAVMFANVDGFSRVRDAFGPDHADLLVREVAARLVAAVRTGDTVGRYGRDEFVIVCEDLEDPAEAALIAGRMVELGRVSVGEGTAKTTVGVSVGLTISSDSGESEAELVDRADAAMQHAKARGLGCQEYSESL